MRPQKFLPEICSGRPCPNINTTMYFLRSTSSSIRTSSARTFASIQSTSCNFTCGTTLGPTNPTSTPQSKSSKKDGRIKYFGLSLNRWQPENGIKALRTGLVDTVQVIYNIFDQSPEDELFPVCRELNIGVIARVPLDEGSLGGNMTAKTRFPKEDWRSLYFGPENLANTLKRVDDLKKILPQGMTLPEMALRFILSNPTVSTTIAGMRKPEHVRQNLAASDAGPLDRALLAELRNHRWNRTPQRWSD